VAAVTLAPTRGIPQRVSSLHVVTRYARGGSEEDILRAIAGEVSAGWAVTVAVGGDSATSRLKAAGATVAVLNSLQRSIRPIADLRAWTELRDLMKVGSYDVVQTHQSKAGVLGRIAARRRTDCLVHYVHMASFGPGYGWIGHHVNLLAEKRCARATDVFVSVGADLDNLLLRSGLAKDDQVVRVRTPIDLAPFLELRGMRPPPPVPVRPGARIAVCLGALEPRKRHILVLQELAAHVSSGLLDLIIAGEGPERDAIVLASRDLGIAGGVHLAGHVSDVPSLLAASDVLVHGASAEGVPRVFIEALAAGLPIVTTLVEGISDLPRGACVEVVPRSGLGLGAAVASRQNPDATVLPFDALDEWSSPSVDRQLGVLRRRIETHLGLND
jgi:glycosyltransferase involved in cell wall biosynthesis